MFKKKGKKMKVGIIIAVLLCIFVFGCSNDSVEYNNTSQQTSQQKSEENTYKLKFGKLLDITEDEEMLIIKAKIEPSYSNKSTINQNGFNVEDLILNQGADKFKEIQYWAVADMNSGSESKVISFTLDEDLINQIKNKNIVGNQIVDKSLDTWILPSLQN